jgi:hypothetical protein
MRLLSVSVAAALCLVLAGGAGCPSPPPDPAPDPTPAAPVWTRDGAQEAVRAALLTEEGDWVAPAAGGLLRDGVAIAADGLREGVVTWLGGDGDLLLAEVHGAGLARSTDGGLTFLAPTTPPRLPGALGALLNPRGRPVPFGFARGGDAVWLATVGGLFRSVDEGQTWSSTPVASSGSLNVLFTGVATDGDDVWAVAQLADSILPSSFAGLLAGTVFHSSDAGATWSEVGAGLGAVAPTAVVLADGLPCVGSMDQGVACLEGGAWVPRGEPVDVVGLDVLDGALLAGTASTGVRAWRDGAWERGGEGPIVALGGGRALGWDGTRYRYGAGEPAAADEVTPGTVSIALSFHVNLYHSYRGDTNDEEGYGQDLRVLRRILAWLDEYPDARADWDIENQFSLDGWLATDGADVRAAIAARVEDGRDDVRVMSWNNGAVASQTREEFDASIARAQASYDAVFARRVAGVQPQENMVTPEHLGWYRALGVDWITLFYSATGFTGLRSFADLSGSALHNPVTLSDPQSGDAMTWVPVYHHADVLDHGGLASWVRQLRRSTDGDVLLAVHFDGDAESWENFDRELSALQPLLDAGVARHTTLQEYLDTHPPVATVELRGDVADGTGDGFQSWAEKDFNHRLFTRIVQAREWASRAEILGGADPAVQAALADALDPRLVALSTTHFGLAAPYLVQDRVEAAWGWADAAWDQARDAFATAEALAPLTPGTVELVNPRPSAGPAWVDFTLEAPSASFGGLEGVAFHADGVELPARVWVVDDDGDTTQIGVELVAEVAAQGVTTLTYALDAPGPRALGGLTGDDAPAPIPLALPLTECAGRSAQGTRQGAELGSLDDRGVRVTRAWDVSVPLCDGSSLVRRERQRWAGLPGTVLVVDGTLATPSEPDQAESVALSPLTCPGLARELTWRTFGGEARTRPVLAGVDAWNGQSIDGYARLVCEDGTVDVSHRVLERSSMAFLPFRERGGVAMVAPLGTLWGSDPFHDGRRTGGSGLGEVVTSLVGSQFRPAAPDWGGQRITYRLLVGEGLPDAVLDLFAHPPAVRVGAL